MLGASKFDMAFNLPSTAASQGYNVPSPFSLCYERSLSLFNSQTGPLLNHRGNLATSSVTEFKPLMKNDLRTGDSLVPSRLNSSLRILDPDLSDSYLKAAGILLSMKNSAMFRVNSTCQSTWTLSPPPIVSNFDIDVHPRMSIPWIKDTSQFGNQLFSEKNISSVNNTLEWKLRTTGNDDSSASNELEKTAIIPARAQHQCKICHKIYGRLSALKTHLKLHRDKKAYKCEECGKLFSQQANLKAHHRTHTGEKPFQCKICKRRFAQSSSVTTHMRTHSGERPYQCTICRRGFADSSTLTKHIRVHTGERPYQCDVCHTKFSQSGNLKRHMSIHDKHSKLSQDLIVEN